MRLGRRCGRRTPSRGALALRCNPMPAPRSFSPARKNPPHPAALGDQLGASGERKAGGCCPVRCDRTTDERGPLAVAHRPTQKRCEASVPKVTDVGRNTRLRFLVQPLDLSNSTLTEVAPPDTPHEASHSDALFQTEGHGVNVAIEAVDVPVDRNITITTRQVDTTTTPMLLKGVKSGRLQPGSWPPTSSALDGIMQRMKRSTCRERGRTEGHSQKQAP
jgi:hypothetical protein